MAMVVSRIVSGIPCAICGRLLTNPESRKRGIGPDCYAKALTLQAERVGEQDKCDLPWDDEAEDVTCRRDEDNPYSLHFNIPMYDWETKRSGYEWGYLGTGPSAFALNILLHFGVPREAALLGGRYHDFKAAFVAALPKEGGTIPGSAIRAWIRANIPPHTAPITQMSFFTE